MKTHQTPAGPCSPFVAALRAGILQTVESLQRRGVSRATLPVLRCMVPAPTFSLAGAPMHSEPGVLISYGELFAAEASRLVPSFLTSTREVIL